MADVRTVRVAATVGTRAVSLATGAAAGVAIARTIGPSGRGAYAVITTIATFALAVGHLSIAHSQTYLWAASANRRSLAINAVALGLVVGAVVAAATWLLVHLLGSHLVPVNPAWLLPAALAAVPGGLVVHFFSNLLILDKRITRVNIGQLVSGGFQLVAVIALLMAGHLTVTTVCLVWTVAVVLPVLVSFRTFGGRPRDLSVSLARTTLAIGLRYHAGMVFLYMLFRVDILMLNGMVSQYQVGLYSLAVTLAELTYVTTDSISQVMLPDQTTSSMRDSARLTSRLVRSNIISGSLTLALVLGLAPLLIARVYGAAFANSVPALLALGPGVMALAAIRPTGGYLIRLNKPLRISALTFGAAIANVVLNLILIPRFGIVGASIASSTAYVGLAACYLVWLARSAGVNAWAFVPKVSDVVEPVAQILSRRRLSTPTASVVATPTNPEPR